MFRASRLIAVLTAVCLLFANPAATAQAGSAEPANQAPDPSSVAITKEAAALLIEKAFPGFSKSEDTEQGLSYERAESQLPSRIPVWKFAWSNDQVGPSAYAEIDAYTGDLLLFGKVPNADVAGTDYGYPTKLSRAQAVKKAVRFARQSVPTLEGYELKEIARDYSFNDPIEPLFGPAGYTFSFALTRNGYDVGASRVTFKMDGDGRLKFFRYTGDPGIPPTEMPTITPDEANGKWAASFEMNLVYAKTKTVWPDGSEKWQLNYVMSSWPLGITEQDISLGQPGSSFFGYVIDYQDIPDTGARFEPNRVGKEEAVRRLESYSALSGGMEWESSSYQGDVEVLGMQAKGKDGNDRTQTYAKFNAGTGQLIEFFSGLERQYDEYEVVPPGRLPTMTIKEAKAIADRWLAGNVPDFAARYKRVATDEPDDREVPAVSFSYLMYFEGIPVEDQFITIMLDGNGKLLYLRCPATAPFSDELEGLKPSITAFQAKKTILDSFKVVPVYYSYGAIPYVDDQRNYRRPTLALTYTPNPVNKYREMTNAVNAVSGAAIGADALLTLKTGGPLPADARQHRSAAALQTLLDHGVIRPASENVLQPDKPISRLDFLRLIRRGIAPNMTALWGGYDGPIYGDIGEANEGTRAEIAYFAQRGWLTPDPKIRFNPDASLTREQMAILLSRIIGYGKLSKQLANDPAVAKLKDKSRIADRGAVAICLKIGLLTANQGVFAPSGEVTLAQAAEVMMRVARVQALLDHPLASQDEDSDGY
ncbi:S-layer homology domain-containing protein [Cohnella suwonensis]|uniref:S-layer homology domain-containing protein n=1 Tax=Cohnella suwonensis TaxID=696072 RepID=A0ABW0M0N3_9BACL